MRSGKNRLSGCSAAGSAPRSGRGSRGFESRHSDQRGCPRGQSLLGPLLCRGPYLTKNLMENLGLSMLWYWAAYFIVTGIGVLHTIFNIAVLHMKSMKDGPGMGEGYEKTKPWHPLYNIIIFPIFAYLYFHGSEAITRSNVIVTSLIWGTVTVVFDLIGWVLIKHPWSLTFREFYVDYQPWITLIYITIYASPWIAYGMTNLLS